MVEEGVDPLPTAILFDVVVLVVVVKGCVYIDLISGEFV